MVAAYLLKSSFTFYRQHPLQLVLSILGIVLGVGIVTAVLITNSSSKRAFALSSEALYGRSTHQIVGAQGIDQNDYVQLRKQHPQLSASPIIEGPVLVGNEVMSLIGIDPFAETPFARLNANPASLSSWNPLDFSGLLLSSATAKRLGVSAGDSIEVRTSGDALSVPIAGYLQSDNPAAQEGLLVGDISVAQWILGRGNRIDRIDLMLTPTEANALASELPITLKLNPSASQHQTMLAMTRGFQINLTAMSLLSLLVGAFLIHNTMSFTVLQRRELFAVKRTIGIQSQSILVSILLEAILISIVASTIGVLLGFLLSQQLIKLTTQTINDLYFVLHVQEVWFTPTLFFGGLALGVGCSVLAAMLSAVDAAKTNPIQAHQRSATEAQTRKWLPILASVGVVILLFGVALATTRSQSLLLGFVALMVIIVGYGLLLPAISYHASAFLKRSLAGISPIMSMATGSIERNISRTGLAIAALTIAVSSTFGVDVMIGSFRNSVDQWLGSTLQSDVYVSVPTTVSTRSNGELQPSVLALIKPNELVHSLSTGLKLKVRTELGEFDTLALEPHENQPIGINIISENKDSAWHAFVHQQALLISEPLATKYALQAGDSISIFTEIQGDQSFTIAGVLRDYASSHGQLTLHRNTFNQFWRSRSISSAGILFHETLNPRSATEQLREKLLLLDEPIRLQANAEIHASSLAIFDRTFEVTRVLRWLTVGVAFVGIFSALLALNLERAREFAVLRATGTSRAQLLGLISIQTLWMGLLAGLLAIPLGWAMAEILIHVINQRSFGWSMQSIIPNNTIQSTFVLSCSAALLAGLYPAWKLSRSLIARQLRDE